MVWWCGTKWMRAPSRYDAWRSARGVAGPSKPQPRPRYIPIGADHEEKMDGSFVQSMLSTLDRKPDAPLGIGIGI